MGRSEGREELRILRVSNDVYPDVVGGLGLHVHELSRDQAALGHDVTVLTSDHGDRTLERTERRSGYRVVRLRELAAPLDNGVAPGLVTALSRRADAFDVVHAHSHLFLSSNLAALLMARSDTPLVLTNHGLYSQTAPDWLQRLVAPTLWRATFAASALVYCYTETDRRRLRELGVDTEVAVVPNGVDCSKFTPGEGDERPESKILYVGRFKPGKRVRDLVEAFARLRETRPDCELVLVGDGPTRPEVADLAASRGVAGSVRFRGVLDNDRLPGLYADSDVFVLPSRAEGMPRTVLEAMACGLPVVVSGLPQHESLVDGAGVTVPPERPARLAEALERLLEDEERMDRLGSAARQRAASCYDWADTVRRTTEAYARVL